MNFATAYAENNVDLFSAFEVEFRSHQEKADSRDFEILLRIGCDTFEFIMRADVDVQRFAELRDDSDFLTLQACISSIRSKWFETAKWIKKSCIDLKDNGVQLPTLEKFLRCYDEIESINRFETMDDADDAIQAPMAMLRDQAIEEFGLGQTEPFIP